MKAQITVATPTGAYSHYAFAGGTWTECGKRVSQKASRVAGDATCAKCATCKK